MLLCYGIYMYMTMNMMYINIYIYCTLAVLVAKHKVIALPSYGEKSEICLHGNNCIFDYVLKPQYNIAFRATFCSNRLRQPIECIDIADNERIQTQGRPVSENLCAK